MRLSRMSWRISSALRKQEKGRKRRAQQRASTQLDVTSESAGNYMQGIHRDIFTGSQYLSVFASKTGHTIRGIPVHLY